MTDRDAEKIDENTYVLVERQTYKKKKVHTHSIIDLLIDRKADSLISKNIHRKTALIQID